MLPVGASGSVELADRIRPTLPRIQAPGRWTTSPLAASAGKLALAYGPSPVRGQPTTTLPACRCCDRSSRLHTQEAPGDPMGPPGSPSGGIVHCRPCLAVCFSPSPAIAASSFFCFAGTPSRHPGFRSFHGNIFLFVRWWVVESSLGSPPWCAGSGSRRRACGVADSLRSVGRLPTGFSLRYRCLRWSQRETQAGRQIRGCQSRSMAAPELHSKGGVGGSGRPLVAGCRTDDKNRTPAGSAVPRMGQLFPTGVASRDPDLGGYERRVGHAHVSDLFPRYQPAASHGESNSSRPADEDAGNRPCTDRRSPRQFTASVSRHLQGLIDHNLLKLLPTD